MSGKKSLFYNILAVFAVAITHPALAADPLRFDYTPSQRLQLHIGAFLQTSDSTLSAPVYAGTDLNKDGLKEYIVRDAACESGEAFCTYLIFADDGAGVLELGRVEARRLMLGNGYTAGVRDLLAAENPANDFEYQLYVWEPRQSRYTIKAEGKDEGS